MGTHSCLTGGSACRCIRHNVPDTEYDLYTSSYDLYRKRLTAGRAGLYISTLAEVAMDYSRGFSCKYEVHTDTAVRWLLQTGRYWLHSSLASVGKAFDPIKLDMCA